MCKRNKLKNVTITICIISCALLIYEKVLAFNPDDYNNLQETNECNQCDLSELNLNIDELLFIEIKKIIDIELNQKEKTILSRKRHYLKDARILSTNLDYSNLEGNDLRNAELRNTSFKNANLRKANFSNADLEKVDFTGANLLEANFEDSNLRGVNFKNSDLRSANFEDSDLTGSVFYSAQIEFASFIDAKMCNTHFGTKENPKIVFKDC